ncbi:MAG: hypothetical protein JNL74_01820 [Fibrobacteres bacterium]|nr:hypothetical protein [Fibrobacterota bacterium]
MIKFLLALPLIILAATSDYLSPKPYVYEINRGIDFVIIQQYDSALALFKHDRNAPEDKRIIFLFCRVLALEAMMVDYESNVRGGEFDSISLKLEQILIKKLKSESNSSWLHFYYGSLLVTDGAHQVRFAKYLDFTKNMFKGMTHLNKSYELDNGNTDAAFCVGLYSYAKSKLVQWLPGVEGVDSSTISAMERASVSGIFTNMIAAQTLVNLYAENGNWEKAEATKRIFCSRYPEARAIRWILGKAAYAGENYSLARAQFNELMPLIDAMPSDLIYNRLSLALHLSMVDFKTGAYKEASERTAAAILKFGDSRMTKTEIALFDKIKSYNKKAAKKQ